MNVKRTMVAGLLAGSLMVPALVASADSATDDKLEDRVEKSLSKDEKIGHVDVDVSDGVATLRGEVASVNERAKAERTARLAGAKKIVNLLEIDADKAVARIKERAEAKKDRIDEQASRQKEAVDRQAEIAGKKAEAAIEKRPVGRDTTVQTGTDPAPANKEVFDPLVTAKVKTRIIKDDLLDKSDINVDTDKDGQVTLRGTVASEAAHARALELARTTSGVRQVVDKLTVKPPAPVVK
jgi:osmotically-inducible protein OsmY